MGYVRSSEEENVIFMALLKRDGAFELARKIAKLKSYKALAQSQPYDGAERPFSLDYEYTDVDGSVTTLTDLLSSNLPTHEPAQVDQEFVTELKRTLSPRQKELVELLEQGYKTTEAARLMGYKNTGGVRYLKWSIHRKYNRFKAEY